MNKTNHAPKPLRTETPLSDQELIADRGILGERWLAEQIARADAQDVLARLKARR